MTLLPCPRCGKSLFWPFMLGAVRLLGMKLLVVAVTLLVVVTGATAAKLKVVYHRPDGKAFPLYPQPKEDKS